MNFSSLQRLPGQTAHLSVCLSVSPTPPSPFFSARFVFFPSFFPPFFSLAPSLSRPSPPRPGSSFSPPSCLFALSLPLLPAHLLFPWASFSFAPPPPPFLAQPPSSFCPAEGWPGGLRGRGVPRPWGPCPRPGTPLRSESPRAGRAASLPPARPPGLWRANNGHIVPAAHRPPRRVAAGGTLLVAAREESQRPRSRSAAFVAGWETAAPGGAGAHLGKALLQRAPSLPLAAGPPCPFPVAPLPLLREGIHSTLGDSLQSELRAFR